MPVVATYVSTLTNIALSRSVQVTSQAGDIIVVAGGGENNTVTLDTPTGNSISYTLQQSIVVSNYATAYIWTGTDSTGGTDWTLTVTSPNNARWGFTVFVVRNSTGIGTSVKNNNDTGAATIDISTAATDSDVIVINTDWNAIDGSSRTWTTVNGVTPTSGNSLESAYGFVTSIYTIYGAYYPTTGTAGTKTVGLSQPGGQKYSIIALEMLPAAAPAVEATVAWLSA